MVGLAGEGQNFDGNGMYVRFQPGGGDQTVSLGASGGLTDKLFANAVLKPLGTRPAFPGKRPPYKPDVPCYKNAAARTSTARRAGRPTAAGRPRGRPSPGWSAGDEDGDPQARARLRLRPRAGAGVALLVGGYILSNQRFYLPHWVPVVGSDFVDYKAEFSTAQSVTPGQGQTVQIAGVDVGDITKVDLVDGRAVVTMKIRRKYTPIYKDATALLRPKTGLNDMVIELDARLAAAGEAPDGLHHPDRPDAAQRQLRRDPVLAGHRHAQLPAAAGRRRGRGARRPGQAPVGRRSSASSRPAATWPSSTARWPCASATSAARSTTSACSRRRSATRTTTWRRWSTPPTAVFKAFANQDANLRQALQELPGRPGRDEHRAGQGRQAGQGARADARRAATRRPRPRPVAGADAPVPAPRRRRSSRTSCGPSRATALPVVKVLRPAARDLAAVTPKLTTSLQVAQLPAQRAGLQPAGQGGGLPLLGLVGQPRRRHRSSPPRTRTARSAAASSWPRARRWRSLHQLSGPVPQLGTLGALLNPPDQNVVCPTTSQAGSTPAQPGTTTPTVPTLPVRGQGRSR